MLCPRCGEPLNDGVKFCTACGAPAEQKSANAPAPGFSDRATHPEVLRAVKKNQKASGVFMLLIVPLPLIGFLLFSLFSDEMEFPSGLLYGAIISGVFLVFALIGILRSRAEKPYEAVVTAQTLQRRTRHKGENTQEVTEYVTRVRTSDGREKKIVESGVLRAYSYLKVGDRFRYHPTFAFPYERYDKANAPCLYCAGCGRENPVENDRCAHCGIPLIK